MPKLSIILPIHNELRHGWLKNILENLCDLKSTEVLIVDCGSSDGSLDLVAQYSNFKLIQVAATHRAGRIEAGLKTATGEILFLHHPRSLPDRAGLAWLVEHSAMVGWGAFTHRFDQNHPLLRFTSWYSNRVRGDWRSLFYLDHCLFVSRTLWSRSDVFPQQEIFEDTRFSMILRRRQIPRRLPFVSRTSAQRFRQNGIYHQALLLQATKMAFYLGISPTRINSLYEKGLHFNNLASRKQSE